jgi:hypothetical protein
MHCNVQAQADDPEYAAYLREFKRSHAQVAAQQPAPLAAVRPAAAVRQDYGFSDADIAAAIAASLETERRDLVVADDIFADDGIFADDDLAAALAASCETERRESLMRASIRDRAAAREVWSGRAAQAAKLDYLCAQQSREEADAWKLTLPDNAVTQIALANERIISAQRKMEEARQRQEMHNRVEVLCREYLYGEYCGVPIDIVDAQLNSKTDGDFLQMA